MSVTILDGSAGLPLLLKEWAYLAKLPNQNDVKVILTEAVQHVRLEPRQILYRQGEPNEFVYHLLKGALFQERTVHEKGKRPQRVLYYTQKPGAVAGVTTCFTSAHTLPRRARWASRANCSKFNARPSTI
ncbi:MAG: hypothetical protein R3A44_08195 [Caldilineaceae bacterium]